MYQIQGIIVKKQTFGENDLLITLLSPNRGLVKVVAPQARNHKSILRGKTELLRVNNFSLFKGKNLDRIMEIDTIESYPKLSQNIAKLTIVQYLTELILSLAMKEQSQEELYTIFREHLKRIEQLNPSENLYPYIAQSVFHCLAVTGIAPNTYYCLQSQKAIKPNFEEKNWQIKFSFHHGGLVSFEDKINSHFSLKKNISLKAIELALLQSLTAENVHFIPSSIPPEYNRSNIEKAWIRVEKILRDYLEFYLGHKLKSAQIMSNILQTQMCYTPLTVKS